MPQDPRAEAACLLRWRDVYSEAELYKAAVRLYTKPVFQWRKASSTSTGVSLWAEHALPGALTTRLRGRGTFGTFAADNGSLRRKGNHIVARVSPTGENIALSRDRIQNLAEVEQALPQATENARSGATARERQVLAFHKKYKSTSPLYERIRAKYPDW